MFRGSRRGKGSSRPPQISQSVQGEEISPLPDTCDVVDAFRAKSGTERFERCFERNYGDVARYCARRLPKHADAEDAATEVFTTAWRRRRELPAEPRDRLWLFGIARRVVANATRAHLR